MKKITVSEQTLKSLMQNTSSPLLFREKTAIAECIDGYGADIVELGEIKKAARRYNNIQDRFFGHKKRSSVHCRR